MLPAAGSELTVITRKMLKRWCVTPIAVLTMKFAFPRYRGSADRKTIEQAEFGADFLKVDYCSYDPSHQNANAPAGGWVPTIPTQLKSWQDLRDALNATGRPIYTEFCPRSYSGSSCRSGRNCLIPPNKTTQDCNPGQRCINDGPPHEWSGEIRKGLANAILTEYGNSHDSCEDIFVSAVYRKQLRTQKQLQYMWLPTNSYLHAFVHRGVSDVKFRCTSQFTSAARC